MRTEKLLDSYRLTVKEMGEYHGWQLPAMFSSVEHEFDAAMRRSVIVDHSYFGRIEVTGADRLDFLHRLSTNELNSLKPGTSAGTILTSEKGRIIDYVTVCLLDDKLILVTSPGMAPRIIDWLSKYHVMEDIKFRDVTLETAMCSLLGPRARSSIKSSLDIELPMGHVREVPYKSRSITAVCVEISRMQAVHLIGGPAVISSVWKSLVDGRPEGVLPMGYLSYELYRISRGVPSIAGELSEAFNPLEVGLREVISFTKGCYIGQEVIARLDTYLKVHRRLIGLFLTGPPGKEGSYPILMKRSKEVGVLTSWSERPLNNRLIGLGVVESSAVREGDTLQVGPVGLGVQAIVLSIPILVQGSSVA